MRICFICGSLEPGRDGVGDYVRRLAAELIRQGHSATGIALNDASLQGIGEEKQSDEGTIVAVLRLPRQLAWSERLDRAHAWLARFRADWVSLQFVPYAFHSRGFPFNLAVQIRSIVRGVPLHVMMHETWIGFTRIAPVKHRLMGRVQRYIVCSMLRRLRPAVIHTSNRLYQLKLEDSGFQVSVLPLFSNIPVCRTSGQWMRSQLAGLGIAPEERSKWVLLGVFGSIHPGFSPTKLLAEQLALAVAQGKKLAFLCIGKGGALVDSLRNEIDQAFGTKIGFLNLGEQTTSRISEYLSILDFGIATMPREFLDKSSTIAAMRAHQLSILVPHSVDLPEYRDRLESYKRGHSVTVDNRHDVSYAAEEMVAALGVYRSC